MDHKQTMFLLQLLSLLDDSLALNNQILAFLQSDSISEEDRQQAASNLNDLQRRYAQHMSHPGE